MKRFLLVLAVVLCVASSAFAQYPYGGYNPYGGYSNMRINLGGGNFYNYGYSPYGGYSGMQLNLGGGSYYNTGYSYPVYGGYQQPFYGGYGYANPYGYGGWGAGY